MPSLLVESFQAQTETLNARNGHKPTRRPLVVSLGATIAVIWFRLSGLRSVALQLLGFTLAVIAAYTWQGLTLALVVAAVSCFVLEWLTGESAPT